MLIPIAPCAHSDAAHGQPIVVERAGELLRREGRAEVPDAPAEALLSIREVVKRFGKRTVLRGISLDVAPGEFLTILGESGSGKTTLLRLIAGFERWIAAKSGWAASASITIPPHRRQVNTVFQSYALFPHLSRVRKCRLRAAREKRAASGNPARVEESAGHGEDARIRAVRSCPIERRPTAASGPGARAREPPARSAAR